MDPKRRSPVYLILIFIVVLASCSKQMYRNSNAMSVFYPLPPDTARIQFLTRYGNSADLTGGQSKFKSFIVGQEKELPILKPYGMDIFNGILFIADAGMSGLQMINFQEGTFDTFTPGGRGKLRVPINCFVDVDGNLYVTDVEREQVVIFDESLSFTGEIAGSENFKPTDVCVTGDTILVTDPNNNRINFYNRKSLKKLASFPLDAEVGDDHWLYNPLNLCVSENTIYVTDFGDSRIKLFTLKGEFIDAVGSYGNGLAHFVRPKGIAVDNDQNLYVVDAGFENVQVFDKEGQLLMFFGGPYKGHGDMYLPANVIIDYDHLTYFEKYVDPDFELKYIIFVTNQYGPDKVTVYGRIEPKL